jgi:hypothetical protein
MARARRLAMAKATRAPLVRFLFGQSDVILMLCGGPAVWYIAQRRRQSGANVVGGGVVRGPSARAIHQLRQVFTALLLGTELLARKASTGKTGEIVRLARRLNSIVRDGLGALAALGEPLPADLLDEHGAPLAGGWEADDQQA